MAAKLAGLAFEEELQRAAEERDALIRELADALQDDDLGFPDSQGLSRNTVSSA